MLAIVKIGSSQYKVKKGLEFKVEKLDLKDGEKLNIEHVLMASDGAKTVVGEPVIKGAKVVLSVVRQTREKTVLVFKKKRRKHHRKLNGHRQPKTIVVVEDIVCNF